MKQDPFDTWINQLTLRQPLRHSSSDGNTRTPLLDGLRPWALQRRQAEKRRAAILTALLILILNPILLACTPQPDPVAIDRPSLPYKTTVCNNLSSILISHENA